MEHLTKDQLLVAPRQQLIDTIFSLQTQIDKLGSSIQALSFQLDWFKRQTFGAKSERFVPDDDLQMALDLGINVPQEKEEPRVTVTHSHNASTPKKPGHGRGTMPTHLPVVTKTLEPQKDTPGMVRIGEEHSWRYEMKPGSLYVVETIRPVYANPDGAGVVCAKLPPQPVEKGNAGPSLMAAITTDKFVYHMPLDRQRKKFKSEYNVDFSESWLCDLVKNTGFWVTPVALAYKKRLLTTSYICADETPIPVLVKDKRGKTHRGYFWVYYDPLGKVTVFDYSASRSGAAATNFLADFKGVLQADGYDGYNEIVRKNGLRRAGCMDHVRRRFEQALDGDNERATYALNSMRNWYEVEAKARENGLTPEERFTLRSQQTVPSMKEFGQWLIKTVTEVLPKSAIGQAITYAHNQWLFFEPFMTDPRVELSNIMVENSIRPIAIGRKNYLFMGSHESAKTAASIYTIFATAKNHSIDPLKYLTALLTHLPASQQSEIERYLIPQWKPEEKDTTE